MYFISKTDYDFLQADLMMVLLPIDPLTVVDFKAFSQT